MSCSKCIYIMSSNCLTWQCDPLSSAWLLFSQAQSRGQGYKSALYTWWCPSLPRKHLQASACASADHACGITWGRGGWPRWGKSNVQRSALHPWLPRKLHPRNGNARSTAGQAWPPVVPPSTVILFHFPALCLVVLCWTRLPRCLVSFAVMVAPSALAVFNYRDSLAQVSRLRHRCGLLLGWAGASPSVSIPHPLGCLTLRTLGLIFLLFLSFVI